MFLIGDYLLNPIVLNANKLICEYQDEKLMHNHKYLPSHKLGNFYESIFAIYFKAKVSFTDECGRTKRFR